MGVKKFIKKSVAFVAAAAMALTMVVVPAGNNKAYADTTQGDNLELSKKIELQQDGNYKITLESYATGKDTVTTTTEKVPLDIVLVLDQSGSMAYAFDNSIDKNSEQNKELGKQVGNFVYGGILNNYEARYKDGKWQYNVPFLGWRDVSSSRDIYITRLGALRLSVKNFVNLVENDAKGDPNTTEDDVNHRIAIVGFASESGSGNNTEILSVNGSNSSVQGSSNKSVGVKYSDINDTTLSEAFQDPTTNSGKEMISNAIDALDYEGATRTDLGMDMAKKILDKSSESGHKKLAIMFTDGEPTMTSDFNTTVANDAIKNAKSIEDSNGKVYSIGIFDGADPNGTSDENKFMNYVSSNYPNATAMNSTGNKIEKPIYYKTASTAGQLSDVFESIQRSETTSGTTVELTGDSVLRDIISDKFELPDGAGDSAVSVYTADSKSVSSDGKNITWDTAEKDTSNKYPVSINGNTVDVTGFDYSQNYVTASKKGKKLIVEILVNGLQSGIEMESNDTEQAKSGIYKNSTETTAVKNFVSPKVNIPEYSYVLDYGKKVTIPNTDQSQNKAYSETTKINSTKAAPTTSPSIKKTYGTFALENKTLTYQPRRINWDGFDSIFSFGKKTGDEYEWSKTNVIPANSVYYEDDFGLTETKSEGEDESNIKIVYTGDWDTVPKNSRKDNSTQDSSNSQYGWDSSYVDDTQYSNGSAHMSSTVGATATFRFTGTGVEIYSRTDLTAGKVTATLRQIDKDGNKIAKTATIVDNKSSETYYQIPTLFFNDLDYGTYEVSIRVSAVIGETTDKDGNQSKRSNYYLDGIRVYNPLGKAPTDSTVKGAYEQAGEYNATYKKVRDILLDASNFTSDQIDENGNIKEGATFNNSGVVFIDEKEDGQEGSTSVVGTFKKYGPKDEVYLKKNQLIAFEINEGYTKLFVGAKTINGVETSMEVTDGNKAKKLISISSASDMYYEVDAKDSTKTPGRRLVIIKNTGDGLLSITKIRATGEGYKMDLGLTSNEVFTEANKFSSLPINKTNESGMPTENVNSDVKIDESDKSDKPNKTDNTNQNVKEFIKNLFGSINKWFSK